MTFVFFVNGSQPFNLSINHLTVGVRELPRLETIVPHDPLIQNLNHANNVNITDGTTNMTETEIIEALNTLTDEKYLNRSKFIEDALIRTIKTEFPDIASRYEF